MEQTILCLANSTKNNNHCVAGRSIQIINGRPNIGEWVRPTGGGKEGALLNHEASYPNHHNIHPGEVASFQSQKRAPLPFQPENQLIQPGCHWKQQNLPDIEQLLLSCLEHPKTLWDQIPGAQQDRVPESGASRGVRQSLYFIQPQSLSIEQTTSMSGYPQTRAHFTYNENQYNLVITDPKLKRKFQSMERGIYATKSVNNYGLCISLGMPFYGYHYKLVASIVPLS